MATLSNNKEQPEHAAIPERDDPESIEKATWKAMFAFTTKKHLLVLCSALLSAVVAALTLPAFAIVYGLIFHQFADFGSGKITSTALLHNAATYCLVLTGISTLNWILNSIFFFLFVLFGELQARSARDRVFDALLRKDVVWFDSRDNGIAAMLPAIQMHVRDLQMSVSAPFGEGLQCLIQAVGALGVAFYFSWNLTLVIICIVPLVYLVMTFLSRRLSNLAQEQADRLQQALKVVTNATHNIETVKCFNGERIECVKYAESITIAAKLYKRLAHNRSFQIGFMQFITLSVFVQGFWYGSHLISTGSVDSAQVMTTFWAALMAVQGITGFLPQLIVLQKGRVAGARLQALIEDISNKSFESETEGVGKPDRCVGDIEFRNVSFSYPTQADQKAIRHASMFFPAGQTTFVIGRSGSGKSTIGQLLVRFYQPSSGHIVLDGVPMERLNVQWLRSNVMLVEQHSVLFNETIRENVALGRKSEPEDSRQVEQAVKFARLEQVIRELPDGLSTELGMNGSSLSGGQKQRLAIARSWIRDTPVLILDESTSALDYITKKALLEAIRTWRSNKTTIIITHDLSQIRLDDFVYMMEKGEIVQEGYRKEVEATSDSVLYDLFAFEQERIPEKEMGQFLDDKLDILPFRGSRPETSHAPATTVSIIPRQESLSPLASPRPTSWFIAPPITQNLMNTYENKGGRRYSVDCTRNLPLGTPSTPGIWNKQEHTPRPGSKVYLSRENSHRVPRGFVQSLSMPHSSDLGFPVSRMRGSNEAPVGDEESGSKQSMSAVDTLPIMEIIKSVWPKLGWKSRFVLFGALFCAFVHAAATPVFAWVFARLLSTLFSSGNQRQRALTYALSILAIAIADGLASYGLHYLFDYVAQAWVDIVRTEAMERVLAQPREFFDREENCVSRIAECLGHFAEEARNLPGRFAGIAIVIVVMVTIAVIWSLTTCWKLTLVALACGPVLFCITKCYNMISSRWEKFCNESDERIGHILHETFFNIRTVRCLVLEDYFRSKHKAATTNAVKLGIKRALYCGSIFGLNYAGVLFVAALLFWYGAVLVSNGEYQTTSIIETFTILLLSVNHVNYIGNYIPQINLARDAGSRLLRLARLPKTSHELTGTVHLDTLEDIRFRDTRFAYPTREGHIVLRGANLNIPHGRCVAIVGSSGSGKSTIAALLLKLYQTNIHAIGSQPDISISRKDIKVLHTESLRSRMATVSQNPVLFPGTIAENIAYGLSPSSLHSSMESIRLAARSAGISDFIESLPQSYHTVVGEGGSGLSGGQAQRIAIARALVREPDVLILDEATSALDVESAEIIRETIQRLVTGSKRNHLGGRKKMTVIIITHSKEMMEIAEQVVMLDEGMVVEEGSFAELKRKRGGAFARLLKGERDDAKAGG